MIHMKKHGWILRFAGLMLVSYTLLVVGVMASGAAGSQTDPLVTLSYLNDTFMAQLMGKVDEKLAERDKTLSDKLNEQVQKDSKELAERYGTSGSGSEASGTADTFVVVTLSNGQTLNGAVGCEVMLRIGTASCVSPSAPGLVDETGGGIINNGDRLTTNHLYMMTISDRGVRATAATVKLLVRGGYTII